MGVSSIFLLSYSFISIFAFATKEIIQTLYLNIPYERALYNERDAVIYVQYHNDSKLDMNYVDIGVSRNHVLRFLFGKLNESFSTSKEMTLSTSVRFSSFILAAYRLNLDSTIFSGRRMLVHRDY